VNNRTTDKNYAAGALYFDIAASYKFLETDSVQMEAFFKARNIANKDPAMIPYGWSGTDFNNPPYNTSHYDYLGRVFRAGVRFQL
jgi:iron complex outermembrane receptor protein